TWVPVANSGWPQGQMPDPYSLATLADGSLLLQFFDLSTLSDPILSLLNTNVSFYGWRPGDIEWFPVTPRPGEGTLLQSRLTPPANGPQSIWIVVRSKTGDVYSVRQCLLE